MEVPLEVGSSLRSEHRHAQNTEEGEEEDDLDRPLHTGNLHSEF